MKKENEYIVKTNEQNNLTINNIVISKEALEQNALGYKTQTKDNQEITYLTIASNGNICKLVPNSLIWGKFCANLLEDEENIEKKSA